MIEHQLKDIHGFQPSFMVYDNADIGKRGEQPLHETVQHCMEHIPTVIQNINALNDQELDQLTLITQKIDNWSLAKCKFYDASWTGFLKRVISCCRNAWSFGVFRSSGEQGLIIASILREEIQKRRDSDNVEPEERFRLAIEKISKDAERKYLKLFHDFSHNEMGFIEDEADKYVEVEDLISPYSADNSPFKGKRDTKSNSGKQTKQTTIQIISASPPTAKSPLDHVRRQLNFEKEASATSIKKLEKNGLTTKSDSLLQPSNNKPPLNRSRSLTFCSKASNSGLDESETSTIESTIEHKNDRQKMDSRARSFSYTETPQPKIFVPESPSWQLRRNKKIEATQMPENLSIFDEVIYRLENSEFGEPGKIYDQLNTLFKENKLIELIEKLGTGKNLDTYWLCESREQVVPETNRIARIERLKIIFKHLSHDQFMKSITLDSFFKIIGDSTNHYARVATDVFSTDQLILIASLSDTETRLNLLYQLLVDMAPAAEIIEARSGEMEITNMHGFEFSDSIKKIKAEVNDELYAKIEAIIVGIGKISIIVKTTKECVLHLSNIELLIGKRAPPKRGNELLRMFKEKMAL
ncbi:MAG: hypothetical protein H0T62_13320 [Parachlamydiaceae bacterium]|nr:hypothetical protein [Parachlamydiaceae bacterium]